MDLLWQVGDLHSGMRDHTTLNAVPDDELLRRLREILGQSRRTEADLVAHVAEVDARKLYLREAAPSMYAYCTQRLHLSEAEAWLRIRVARASRKHSLILPMLRDGRLHLSGIVVLAPHLTIENGRSVLKRAVHKTKRQIEELVAEIAPREDAPACIRKLPERRGQLAAALTGGLSPETGEAATAQLAPDTVALAGRPDVAAGPAHAVRPDEGTTTSPQLTPDTCRAAGCQPGSGAPGWASGPLTPGTVVRPLARSTTVEPLAPARFKIQFTANAALRDKLERLQALMRTSVPDGDLATVIDIAVTREILMCRAHNALLAEQDYGEEKMALFKRSASRLPVAVANDRAGGAPTKQTTERTSPC